VRAAGNYRLRLEEQVEFAAALFSGHSGTMAVKTRRGATVIGKDFSKEPSPPYHAA
jgi:hypothetical protein